MIAQFEIIYGNFILYSGIVTLILMVPVVGGGLLRSLKRYCFAQSITGKPKHSSIDETDHSILVWLIALLISRIAKYFGRSVSGAPRATPGAHPIGSLLDAGILLIAYFCIGLMWPILLLGLVIGIPAYYSHRHFKRKREFLEKLKGES